MMPYNGLYVFVEGDDDERFFNAIIRPLIVSAFSFIKIIKYAQLNKKDTEAFIKTLDKNGNDYIFIADFDSQGDASFCVSKRKQKEYEKYANLLAKERIFVVKEVIESWYLAGISEEQKEKFKIENFTDTQCLNKHYFDALSNAPDFRIEILKGYSLEKAVFCNASLCYFNDKFLKKYAIINNT